MNFLAGRKKFLFLVSIIIAVLFFGKFIFAYDETIVHPSLTEEMAKFYNKNFKDNELTKVEIELMKKGSVDEDINVGLATRSANHFFNPFGYSKWADSTAQSKIVPEPKLTSKQWAHAPGEQMTFPGGDYTWEKAIEDYAQGNKQHAYESLGHILHLIEDAAVPAHVRNDLHISFAVAGYDTGEREPYEDWTRGEAMSGNINFDFAEKLFQENKKPISQSSLDGYFDDMAIYTNTKFFSKDTIYAYSQPNNNAVEGKEKLSNGDIVSYVYGLDENGNKTKLASISFDDPKNPKIYTLNKLEKEIEYSIYSDYWSRLAPKSILVGAGVIKLFKEEAEKAAGNYKPTALSKLSKYPYGLAAWMAENGGTIARNGMVISQLAAGGIIYGAKQMGALVNNLITSASNKISFLFTPSASSNYTLVFDMSQAIPASSITFFGSIAQIQPAKAADFTQSQISQEATFSAAFVSQSEPEIIIEPNKEINLKVQFKNTGASVWQQNKIYLNVYLKNDVANQFYHLSWLTLIRPAKLTEPQVNPGSFGNFNFLIKSPLTAGDYFFKVRPVWQDDTGNFNWLAEDIVSWHIKVKLVNIAQTESDTQDKNPENITDISQNKAQDTNTNTDTNTKNNIEEKTQTPSQEEDKNTVENKDNKIENNEATDSKNGQDNANNIENTEITTPTAPAPFTPFYRRARDIYPPETDIIVNPSLLTNQKTAVFKFYSSEIDPNFYCRLDSGDFTLCEENTVYDLSDGEHRLEVKAEDRFRNIDLTPAEFSWTIDSTPPAKITDFAAVAGNTRGKIKLSWTKPEENVSYEIRYAEEKKIVETGATSNQINWQAAGQILENVDNNAEQIEIGSATALTPGKTYYFAIKSKDELNNVSEISNSPSSAANAKADHIVISEIKVAGETGQANNEFIELYNPTADDINLKDLPLKLHIINSTGKSDVSKEIIFTNSIIKSLGYFLIASQEYSGTVMPDATYSASGNSLVADGAAYISQSAADKEKVIDLVGWGAQPEGGYEKNPFPDISKTQSIERKANYSSSAESMSIGADKYLGNGWDSDNNSADFVLQTVPNPQNSQSPIEPRFPVFLQNEEKSYYALSTNCETDGTNCGGFGNLPKVSQTIGKGFDQRLVKATARVKCNSDSSCNISYKSFAVNGYYNDSYSDTQIVQGSGAGFSATGGLGNDPSWISANSTVDVNFSGWSSFTFDLKYYYKITFQINIDYQQIKWGGSSFDSYANGNSIDYLDGADLYFKLSTE